MAPKAKARPKAKAKPKSKTTTRSPKAPRPQKKAQAAAAAATAAAAAAIAAAVTAAAAARAAAQRAAASAKRAAAAAAAATTAADDAAAAATLARSAALTAARLGEQEAPHAPGDPLVAFRCALPAFFQYVPTSRLRTVPPMTPARPGSIVTPAWAGCKCRNCSRSCSCRADVDLGLSAIARCGPDAVVLLVECGQCACGGGSSSSSSSRRSSDAAPGQQQQQQQQQHQQRRLACRPTQGGCAFRVAVQAAPGAKGRGLFAEEAVPAGAFVIEYAGEALLMAEVAAQLRAYDEARWRWRQRQEEDEEEGESGEGESGEGEEEEPGGASGHALLQIAVHGRRTPSSVEAGGPYRLCASIDATVRGNAARFINHSCSPNLGAVLVMARRSRDPDDREARLQVPLRVALFSRRAIAAGEELTMGYGSSGGGGAGGARCECGAAACGGWLPSGA